MPPSTAASSPTCCSTRPTSSASTRAAQAARATRRQRDPALAASDLRNGYVTPEQAASVYGLDAAAIEQRAVAGVGLPSQEGAPSLSYGPSTLPQENFRGTRLFISVHRPDCTSESGVVDEQSGCSIPLIRCSFPLINPP